MTKYESDVEFRKQVFLTALPVIIQVHPDWTASSVTVQAEAIAQSVVPALLSPIPPPYPEEAGQKVTPPE